MKALVIGGTRFIGPFVVRALLAAGCEVSVFHRGEHSAELSERVREITGDRSDLSARREEFRALDPDVVVDMIPLNERDGRDLMEAFRGIAGRVVAVSSEDVYRAYDIVRGLRPGPPDPTPLTEDSPLRERLYPYDRPGVRDYEKILVERAVMEASDPPATVLRLPAVYGPGDYQHRFHTFVKRMDDNRPAILLEEGIARWRWTYGYVGDVARAVALAATDGRASGRVYNVGESVTPTVAERVREVGRLMGWDGEVVTLPKELLPKHLDWGLDNPAQDWTVDTTRLRDELGYEETVTREEALRRAIEWERANPPEPDPAEFDYAAEDEALQSLRQP